MLARCPNFSLKPLEKLCQHEKYRLLKMKENLERAVFSVLKKALGNFDLVKHESSKIFLVSSGVIIGKLIHSFADVNLINLYLLVVVLQGFYFGFRCGVVSEKARNYVSSLPFMNAICCDAGSLNSTSSISVYQVPAPQHLKSNEVLLSHFV